MFDQLCILQMPAALLLFLSNEKKQLQSMPDRTKKWDTESRLTTNDLSNEEEAAAAKKTKSHKAAMKKNK